MNQNLFDKIILDNLKAKLGTSSFGYIGPNNAVYKMYYTANEFQNFIDEMKTSYPVHYSAYAQGKGCELLPGSTDGTPPKMASVASSSRFCYIALRKLAPHIDINNAIRFEKSCPIFKKRGTPPQLDAFSAGATNDTYIEVKCHEIFNTDKEKSLGKSYVNYIYDTVKGIGFDFDINKKPDSEFTIPYTLFDLEKFPTYFDLKQFLCHLLGIAWQNKENNKSATFAYLFFRPKTNDDALAEELLLVFSKLQDEIISVFTSPAITSFCKQNKITLKAYYEYSEVMEPLTASNTHPLF